MYKFWSCRDLDRLSENCNALNVRAKTQTSLRVNVLQICDWSHGQVCQTQSKYGIPERIYIRSEDGPSKFYHGGGDCG